MVTISLTYVVDVVTFVYRVEMRVFHREVLLHCVPSTIGVVALNYSWVMDG